MTINELNPKVEQNVSVQSCLKSQWKFDFFYQQRIVGSNRSSLDRRDMWIVIP